MIASRKKPEEYREVKQYWNKRLLLFSPPGGFKFKHFDIVRFKNGYGKDAPTMDVVCLGISITMGNAKWGATPNVHYYVIKLGKIIKSS